MLLMKNNEYEGKIIYLDRDRPNEYIYFENKQFKEMAEYIEEHYGYEGAMWDVIKQSNNFNVLLEFLEEDGVYYEIEDKEWG